MAKNFKSSPFARAELLVFAVAFGILGAYIITRSFAATSLSANLFVDPLAGNDSGQSVSATPLTYASASGHIVKSLWKACQLAGQANGNVTVGFKAGNYADVPGGSPLPNGEDGINGNCGSATANSVNPNSLEQTGVPVATPAGWTSFVCADGENTDVQFGLPNLYFIGNAHADFEGGCFRFHNIFFDHGGDTGLNTQNIILRGLTRRIYLDSLRSSGAKDIAIYHWEHGPATYCAGTGTNPRNGSGDYCQSQISTGEAQFMNRNLPVDGSPCSTCGGNTDFEGLQFPMIGRNLSGASINVRLQDGIEHDSQSRDNVLWHTGCGHVLDQNGTGANGTDDPNISSNIVVDSMVCFRTDVFGFYAENSNGVTLQNSSFGCASDGMGQSGGLWYKCVPTQPGVEFICRGLNSQTNNLVRFNSFYSYAQMRGDQCPGGYNNVKVIGNLFLQTSGTNSSCESAVLWDYNVYGGIACGGDIHKTTGIAGTTIAKLDCSAISYPPTLSQSSAANVCFDAHPVNPGSWPTVPNLGAYYGLAMDADGKTRSYPTLAGPYITATSAPLSKPGDLNGDGLVNAADLSILLSYWNTSSSVADINKDGTVNVFDLSILLSGWGT